MNRNCVRSNALNIVVYSICSVKNKEKIQSKNKDVLLDISVELFVKFEQFLSESCFKNNF